MAVRRLLVAGRYRLHEPVGAGGMGRVWMARDELLDRDVAVKEFVPPEWMTDTERDRLRTRTLREARSAARLNHPHVVRIYDVVHADDLPWIVMEYVPSRSLYQVIRDDGPLPPTRTARIGLEVLDGLTAAHRAGVLHRDVKPHNVLIGHDGRVVLTDFGLATFVDDGAITGPGHVVGSPQYVSPERARDGASTVESDLWSLGATLYAAVEGRSPYARESAMATLMALATEPPDPPVRAGPLTAVLTGLLRHEPALRLTADQVEDALRGVVAGRPATRPRAAGDGLPKAPNGVVAGRAAVPAPRRPADDRIGDDRIGDDRIARDRFAPAAARSEATPEVYGVRRDQPSTAPTSEPGYPRPAAAGPSTLEDDAGGGSGSGRGTVHPGTGPRAGEHADSRPAGTGNSPDRTVQGDGGSRPDGARPPYPRGVRAAWTRRRLAVAGGLAAALLAGGGGRLAGWLVDRDDPSAARPDARSPAASTAPSGPATGVVSFTPTTCAGPAPANLPRMPQPGALRTGPNNYALVPGMSYYRDPAGFLVAVPDGWTYEKVGTTLCFRDPAGIRVLSVDPARKPSADPVKACRDEAARLTGAGGLPGYEEIGIERVQFVPRAADWEYRYDGPQGNTRLHANTRWVAFGGRGYALGWVTSEFDWNTSRYYLDVIQASFQPG